MGNPAIVIPGFMGSKLAEAIHKKLVWLDGGGLLSPDVTLQALRLDVGDPGRLVPIGILDEVTILPPFWDPSFYKGLTRFLRDNLHLRVFEFYYDWRKSIEEAADRLDDQIRRWLSETGAPQVDLVAHSLGGLVARAYLAKHGPQSVSRLITLGTPHKGTPEALQTLIRGRSLVTFPAGKVKPVARFFPGIYEMIPHDKTDSMFRSGGQDASPMEADGWCDTEEMKAFLATAAATVARLLPREIPVETWMIVGTRSGTLTAGSFEGGRARIDESDAGDGTVAEVSARGTGLAGNISRLTVPFTQHMQLFGDEKVQQRILTPVLLGRPMGDVQLFSGFQAEPLFVPRTANLFSAVVQRLDGSLVPDAEVRLSIAGTAVQNRIAPRSERGDYTLRVVMPGPGGGYPYTVTAQVPGAGETLADRGLLVPTER